MKINIEVDATPEEMRKFFGLPDVTELQEVALEKMKEQLNSMQQPIDPQQLFKALFPENKVFPENMNNFADIQKAFWENFTQKKG